MTLTFGPTIPNIELDRDIFIYYNVINFMFLDRLLLELSCKNTETHTHMHTHRESDEYAIVAFCENATIIKNGKIFEDLT